jgi:hypothetical protein
VACLSNSISDGKSRSHFSSKSLPPLGRISGWDLEGVEEGKKSSLHSSSRPISPPSGMHSLPLHLTLYFVWTVIVQLPVYITTRKVLVAARPMGGRKRLDTRLRTRRRPPPSFDPLGHTRRLNGQRILSFDHSIEFKTCPLHPSLGSLDPLLERALIVTSLLDQPSLKFTNENRKQIGDFSLLTIIPTK